jgi:hypothetical protein
MTLCGRRAPGAAADSPRCPPGNSQREAPWPPARGHAARRPVSGEDCHRPGSTTSTDPGRGWTATSPLPRTAHGKSADRAGKTGRSLASPPAQSVSLLMPMSGLDIPFPHTYAFSIRSRWQLEKSGTKRGGVQVIVLSGMNQKMTMI